MAALESAADVLAGVDLLELDGPQAAVITRRAAAVSGRLTAVMLPVVEADGRWAVGSSKSFASWVADHHHLAVHTARSRVRLGRVLRDHLPLTAAAAKSGQVTAEHAQVLAQLAPATEQRREVLADPDNEVNEAFLVRQAELMGVDTLRSLVRRWAAYTDPDADDRAYVEACDREHLEIQRVYDMYDVRGLLTIEHGQAVRAALRSITPVRAGGDERTGTQRRAPGGPGMRRRSTAPRGAPRSRRPRC